MIPFMRRVHYIRSRWSLLFTILNLHYMFQSTDAFLVGSDRTSPPSPCRLGPIQDMQPRHFGTKGGALFADRNGQNGENNGSNTAEGVKRKQKAKTAKKGQAEGKLSRNSVDLDKRPEKNKKKKERNSGGSSDARQRKGEEKASPKELLEMIDPFKAGQKLRQSFDTALTTVGTTLTGTKNIPSTSKYYLDDRFLEPGDGPVLYAERNPLFDRLDEEDLSPEVLVVGATGAVGRLVVRRLLLDGRFRVRVLVRDLYSRTLNMLGTGVTYCQGDLNNMESLEYALTDVDKIVFCAGAPRPDEDDFKAKFEGFARENLQVDETDDGGNLVAPAERWDQLGSILEVRARLAEQIDVMGMGNLLRAYQNVRHADYGTGQAAKRSLFKFDKRPDDFNLFCTDSDDNNAENLFKDHSNSAKDDSSPKSGRHVPQPQCDWIQNKFGNAVFVGSVPAGYAGSSLGGEAAVISRRLRSRGNPEGGLDLSGFGGFICRMCSDGGVYEAFVRTGTYETDGIEYIAEFGTETKVEKTEKGSKNKFVTVRLPFTQFKAISRDMGPSSEFLNSSKLSGQDIRQMGFRFRANRNPNSSPKSRRQHKRRSRIFFYIALSYIKVFRAPPEPEFVYLSDSRIPLVVTNEMVRDDLRQIVAAETAGERDSYSIFDEARTDAPSGKETSVRSNEETYFKYKAERILRDSGVNYCIMRVAGFNELPTSASTALRFRQTDDNFGAVSRADVARVCVSALLDPDASNVSFYLSKARDGDSESTHPPSFADLESDS